MRFTTTAIIEAAKPEKFSMSDGFSRDRTLVYIPSSLGSGVDTSRGVGTIGLEYIWGTSDNYEQIKNLRFPIKAEVDAEHITNGKKEERILHSLKPLAVSNKPASA